MAASILDHGTVEEMFSRYRSTSAFFDELKVSPFGGFDDRQPDERAEMASLLRAVDVSGARFTLVSLGAAPGEWAVKAERAYRAARPGGTFVSYCLEGDIDHFHLIQRFIEGNGASLSDHHVTYRVVADRDGHALFPIINPDRDWGAGLAAVSDREDDLHERIMISDIAREDRIAANDGKPLEFRRVDAVSLPTLLKETGVVDYLHSDIQGAEADVFCPHLEVMKDLVKVVCIATHGRDIEAMLRQAFEQAGWVEDCGFECSIEETSRGICTTKDGVYVWSNPAFPH